MRLLTFKSLANKYKFLFLQTRSLQLATGEFGKSLPLIFKSQQTFSLALTYKKFEPLALFNAFLDNFEKIANSQFLKICKFSIFDKNYQAK